MEVDVNLIKLIDKSIRHPTDEISIKLLQYLSCLNGYYKILKILPSIFCNKIEKSRIRDVNKIK